ncbi:GNAT family N-acetyltransferase [Lysinimonas soli]|uniref:GNAT family N-acetyltransferase n=1 Tax=Lysinimonas soli TaxID=1074233 RepID=A0ABW0NRR9_9MICO
MSGPPAPSFEFVEPLRTERLVLRPMTLDDVDEVYAYQRRDDVCRYLLHEARSRDEVVEWVGKYAAATRLAEEHDWIEPAIVVDGRVIGHMYLTIASLENRGAEIGWTLHPDFQGKGYAHEAAVAMLDLAFGELGMHRVRAELDPRNDASIALCRRLGMREEAYFVKDLMFRGDWADTGVYAILDEEWAARGAAADAE